MASGGSVPQNIQSSGAAWPQIGVKAVALIDKRIGGIDLLSRLDILPSQSAYRSSDLVTRQDLQRVSRIDAFLPHISDTTSDVVLVCSPKPAWGLV